MEKKIIDQATKALGDILMVIKQTDDDIQKLYAKSAGNGLINVIRLASGLDVKE